MNEMLLVAAEHAEVPDREPIQKMITEAAKIYRSTKPQ